MQKNYRLIVSIITLIITSLGAFAQSEVKYKDVVLDGKPAKLNVATGEITLVNLVWKKKVDTSKIVTESTSKKGDAETTSDFHVVKEGETLFQIANLYNTSLTALKKLNSLETTLIDKGQKLRVKNLDTVTSTKTDTTKTTTYTNYKTNNSNFHIVKRGETLFSLAKRYNLTVPELKNKNDLSKNLITVGQKLRVSSNHTTKEYDHLAVWTVSRGDTLYSISKETGTTVDKIKSLNGLTSNLIKVGQKLQLK